MGEQLLLNLQIKASVYTNPFTTMKGYRFDAQSTIIKSGAYELMAFQQVDTPDFT